MKAIAASSKKAKGKRLEVKIAQLIREYGLDPDAKRMPMSGAIPGFKTDVFTKIPFSLEAKNAEKVKLWEWFNQARDQATIAKPPVLVISGNFRPILAVMNIETWLDLLKEIKDLENAS